VPEDDLSRLIRDQRVDTCVFSYSDVTHEHVMHLASQCIATGSDFLLLSADRTMIPAKVPVVAITAVRTGAGKSQTTRYISNILKKLGKKVVAIRHPMPYGDLAAQACQRFATYADLDREKCTIEEREEYEPHIDNGFVVYAGVDYGRILAQAQEEADVILWDGGNNDLPFYVPALHICIADPHRAGHETSYHPGEANFRRADVIVVNKCDTAEWAHIASVEVAAARVNPGARVLRANSPVTLERAGSISGKKVLAVEDGPTLTHGGMRYGAACVAAKQGGAAEIVDPSPYAVGSIRDTYAKYPNAVGILPAMGYGEAQIAELEETIRRTPCDVVVIGTPIDLTRVLDIDKPAVRVRYDLEEQVPGKLESEIAKALATRR
jgi:predicted GTPase